MEYTRERYFQYYKDTNKDTTEKKFSTLTELLTYLADNDSDGSTYQEVEAWLEMRD